MRLLPTAIGYLRADISGGQQQWDEAQLRSLAGRLGYTYAKTVVFSAATVEPVDQLIDLARRLDLDAIVVPTRAHLDGEIPDALVRVADVITVTPREVVARWSTGVIGSAQQI